MFIFFVYDQSFRHTILYFNLRSGPLMISAKIFEVHLSSLLSIRFYVVIFAWAVKNFSC